MIAAIVFIATIILKPKPGGGGGGDSPHPSPGPAAGTSCKNSSECNPAQGIICDTTGKCTSDLIPNGTNPTNKSAIQEAMWRGGDTWTLAQIRSAQTFFLRSMRADGTWGYWYTDGVYFINTKTPNDTTIDASKFVFSFKTCPQSTSGYNTQSGFLQGNDDLNKAVQCASLTCSISDINTKAGNSKLCNGGGSWQVLTIEDMPSDWPHIPDGMGGKSGNGITSTALTISQKIGTPSFLAIDGDDSVLYWETDRNKVAHAERVLFQVAFVNQTSTQTEHLGNLFEEIFTGILQN